MNPLSAPPTKPLKGETVAVLIATGFNEHDMTTAQRALMETGAVIKTISPDSLAQGWHDNVWGHYFAVDAGISTAIAADYSMLLVPGGARAMDKLKANPHTARLIKGFINNGQPVAFYGEAVGLLAHVNLADGKTVSGPATMEQTLRAGGANWSPDMLTIDGTILTGNDASENLADLVAQTVAHFMNIPAELRLAA
jgi:protease I